MACLVRYSTKSTKSKEPGESGTAPPRLPGREASPAAPPDRVFFLPLTRPSVNSGVGTEFPLQSWRGHRLPEKPTGPAWAQEAGSAVLYSTTPPDSPPDCAENTGSASVQLQCRKYHFSRARRPSRPVTQRKWGRSSCFLRQSIAVSSPLVKIGQNR